MNSKIMNGIIGLCIGDALGVPVEFRSRGALSGHPVLDMIGYGTYNQPLGTWSDDSSLTFCLMDSIAECKRIDLFDIADKFKKWLWEGYWTPYGEVFDVGIATKQAIDRLNHELIRPDFAGGQDEYSNGNGSLMRILPLAFLLRKRNVEERVSAITQVSSITHRHMISIIACVIYTEVAINLIDGLDLKTSINEMKLVVNRHFSGHSEIVQFERILNEDLSDIKVNDIHSTGYVVHTLEASLWSLLTSVSYKEAVLKSINLGEDTDTTGAVTGGLAGLIYGIESIPVEWVQQIARIDEIVELCRRFEDSIANN